MNQETSPQNAVSRQSSQPYESPTSYSLAWRRDSTLTMGLLVLLGHMKILLSHWLFGAVCFPNTRWNPALDNGMEHEREETSTGLHTGACAQAAVEFLFSRSGLSGSHCSWAHRGVPSPGEADVHSHRQAVRDRCHGCPRLGPLCIERHLKESKRQARASSSHLLDLHLLRLFLAPHISRHWN